MEDVTLAYTGNMNAIYVRNSAIAIGDGSERKRLHTTRCPSLLPTVELY